MNSPSTHTALSAIRHADMSTAELLALIAGLEAQLSAIGVGGFEVLTNAQIDSLWIRRDCIDAIQCGDLLAQVRNVVRAALSAAVEGV